MIPPCFFSPEFELWPFALRSNTPSAHLHRAAEARIAQCEIIQVYKFNDVVYV